MTADPVERALPWLRLCGPCDLGIPAACACPPGDVRNVIQALVAEIDRLRTAQNRP